MVQGSWSSAELALLTAPATPPAGHAGLPHRLWPQWALRPGGRRRRSRLHLQVRVGGPRLRHPLWLLLRLCTGVAGAGGVPGGANPLPLSRARARYSMPANRRFVLGCECGGGGGGLCCVPGPLVVLSVLHCTGYSSTCAPLPVPQYPPQSAACTATQQYNSATGKCDCKPGWDGPGCDACQSADACDAQFGSTEATCSDQRPFQQGMQFKAYTCDLAVSRQPPVVF